MAAPHVSGAAALLMARHPELIGQPGRIKAILCKTATDLGRERYFQGHGLVDVHLAAETASRRAALDDLRSLREELDRTRSDAADREEALRQRLDALTSDYHAAIETHDTKLRTELDIAMQRLALTQDNMLQQIDDARTAQRRAETKAAEATQRASTANEALAAMRLQLAGEQKALEQERQATARWAADANTLQQSIASLKDTNAELRGRQASQAEQLSAVQGRALAA